MPASKPLFFADLEQLEGLAVQPVYTSAALADKLDEIYGRVARANFSSYAIREVAQAAPELMYRLFDLRIGLRERAADWRRRELLTHENVGRLRDCLRVLRYVTDMLGEIAIGNARLPPGAEPLRAFSGADHNTLVNWAYYDGNDIPFRSGDVVLMRGRAHNSAAIARIGDVDSQFSHIAIVYIDAEGEHFMVESLIEDGAIINDLAHTLGHGNARAVLYRYKDPELAARAAALIHKRIARSRRPFGQRILYDFTMLLEGRRRMFCAKLVRQAYDMASRGEMKLPTYPTHIVMKNRDFLDRIGVKASETFAPGDIDLEPDFDLVAEWQDYRETAHVRLQDFTMDKLFEWMETYDYRFKETFLVRLVSIFGRLAAHLSEGAKDLISSVVPKVPINMKRKTVAAVAMLHKTAEPIYHELQEIERTGIAKSGRPLHGDEIFSLLEKIRSREGDQIGYLVREGT